ncbi:phage/plasmid replication protein [Rhodocyclus tenuis]|uniref:phage/plasmid replication protein n=1 Tax=Rhodocyclus tenuis TaxID=1066 RepID=UPI001906BD58|nr:phage/plasmid replication protein [Rhodocyclus tenuis]MBK1679880.1 hypothetical protein [Rhodocyclus tenuis]
MPCRFLLHGHDTIESAYYLAPGSQRLLDFEQLAAEKEALRSAKVRHPKALRLGCEEFLLMPNGTKSGYPFLIENDAFSVQFGEFNKPNFYVTYRSFALWQFGAQALHRRFLTWAASVGYASFQPERLSRVDFTFDYQLDRLDFDEDSFVSQATKDNQYRKNRTVQTFRFGEGELMLRIYNKIDEIQEKSAKTWFFDLWGCAEKVWRIEWQVRKEWLRRFGIRSFADLQERQGDLLRVLAFDHTTLRCPNDDSNRSRWALHPLWVDLQARIAQIDGLGVVRELDPAALLDERELRIAVSVYGYLKRIAAISGIRQQSTEFDFAASFDRLRHKVEGIHDELTWGNDVQRRYDEMRLGQW